MATQSLSIFAAARGFFAALWRALRQLFHEVTGTLFFVIAISAAQSAWRIWRRGAATWLIEVTIGYGLLMIVFGIFAFRDARRVRPPRRPAC